MAEFDPAAFGAELAVLIKQHVGRRLRPMEARIKALEKRIREMEGNSR